MKLSEILDRRLTGEFNTVAYGLEYAIEIWSYALGGKVYVRFTEDNMNSFYTISITTLAEIYSDYDFIPHYTDAMFLEDIRKL